MNNVTSNLTKLFDGDTKTVFFPGWSLILSPHEAYYPLLDGEQMNIDSLRMYDRENVFADKPLLVYAITNDWERKLLGTFTGELYLAWVGPYPSRPYTFKMDTAVSNIRGLLLRGYGGYPAELELYGTYTPPSAVTATPPAPPREPLKRMFGVDGFAWNFVEQTNTNIYVSEAKMKALKSFGAFRQYLDWQKSEPVEGRYYFSPQADGGWPLDSVYQRARDADIDVVATIQNIPNWLMATYPDSLKASDNNPVRYGKSFSDPLSYIEQAKLGFQFTARYGRNKNIDSNLVSVYSIPAYPFQKVNAKKIGLGWVRYVECGNEVDKTWRGRKGYMSGREYAANLSAFYDGHLNTMGTGVGVKNADSTMQVVMSGIAAPSTDYLQGMIDWCKEFRGCKPDGRVNLCFDVINYHYYSSDRGIYQTTNGTRGVAPEKSLADSLAQSFIRVSHLYAADAPVWISEQGYDIHQGSTLKAIAIGNRTAAETQADWILRSGLLYARKGLHRSFFYEVFDYAVDYAGKYASMGLLDKTNNTRKPAADFLFQTIRQFGEYRYQETLNNDPFVDRYAWNGQSMYTMVVPDETGRTAGYTLPLSGVDSATLYTPTVGSDSMAKQRLAVSNGQLQLTITETPVFVVPDTAPPTGESLLLQNTVAAVGASKAPFLNETILDSKDGVAIFPNPANEQLYIQNKNGGRWKVMVYDMQNKKMLEKSFAGGSATLALQKITAGMYAVYIANERGQTVFSQFVVKQ